MTKEKSLSHSVDFTNGPIAGKMLKFALPLMFSSILQLLFNAADIIVVGKFAGDECVCVATFNPGAVVYVLCLWADFFLVYGV